MISPQDVFSPTPSRKRRHPDDTELACYLHHAQHGPPSPLREADSPWTKKFKKWHVEHVSLLPTVRGHEDRRWPSLLARSAEIQRRQDEDAPQASLLHTTSDAGSDLEDLESVPSPEDNVPQQLPEERAMDADLAAWQRQCLAERQQSDREVESYDFAGLAASGSSKA